MGMLLSNLKQQGNPLQGFGHSNNRVGMDPNDNSGKFFSKIAVHLFDFSSGKGNSPLVE